MDRLVLVSVYRSLSAPQEHPPVKIQPKDSTLCIDYVTKTSSNILIGLLCFRGADGQILLIFRQKHRKAQQLLQLSH